MKLLVYIMKKIAFLLLLCSLFACSRQAKNVPHSGERLLNKRIYLDSVVVDASYTSGWGNFYLVDSIIHLLIHIILSFMIIKLILVILLQNILEKVMVLEN